MSPVELARQALEVEAEQRLLALGPKLQLAQNLLQQVVVRVEIGTSRRVEAAQARLRLAEYRSGAHEGAAGPDADSEAAARVGK